MSDQRRTANQRRYPRTARVDELIREVVAEELERIDDPRLDLVTVTGVTTDRDLRRARVWLATLEPAVADALAEHRWRLQGAIGRQSNLKRTPELAFQADPAIEAGTRVEQILRTIPDAHQDDDES